MPQGTQQFAFIPFMPIFKHCNVPVSYTSKFPPATQNTIFASDSRASKSAYIASYMILFKGSVFLGIEISTML
jgi:hypothetical protein